MKTKHSIWIFIILSVSTACNDLLEKYPLDEVTEAVFWQSAKDVELFCNKFYSCFPDHRNKIQGGTFNDDNSDNQYTTSLSWLDGTRSIPATADNTWKWENIREVNYFFENYHKTPVSFDVIKHYVGEMHFFKAWYYFDLLKQFGDLPWYNEVLNMNSEGLYAPRVSRSVIADSICSNLDKAILYLSERSSVSSDRFFKDLAIAFKARVCLYEGTWEKYHANTPFGVSGEDGTRFLKMAVNAAEELMGKGYGLYENSDGGDKMNSYLSLFNQKDYSDNPEVIFFKKYSKDLNYTHSILYHGWDSYVSSSLVNQYLCIDGLPVFANGEKNPNFKGELSLSDIVANRDPRLRAMIYTEGEPYLFDLQTGEIVQYVYIKLKGDKSTPTGFNRKKGDSFDYAQYANNASVTAAITMRYAEVLLVYAEAKAELGEISQNDLDKTVNLLRRRVGMPDMQINISFTDPNWDFPNLSPLLNEIRRERRVELAFEGLRNQDICRWAAGAELLVGKRAKGMFFNAEMYPDINPGTDVFIDENGYLDPLQKQVSNGYGFNINRDYLTPIPTEELVLNTNLMQNPGWSNK